VHASSISSPILQKEVFTLLKNVSGFPVPSRDVTDRPFISIHKVGVHDNSHDLREGDIGDALLAECNVVMWMTGT
jgi:hypothetical protein